MRKLLLVAILMVAGAVFFFAKPQAAGAPAGKVAPAVRFVALDLYLDPGPQKLGAYQLTFDSKAATLVGVEGGESAAFADPPFYDPKALAGGRVILAAFHAGPDSPAGRTRVARLHLRVEGAAEPTYTTKLTVAADAAGEPIDAALTAEFAKPEGDAK